MSLKLYTDKSEVFECNVSLQGASIKESKSNINLLSGLAKLIMFLFLGQRIAKDYVGASDLVPYFTLIMLGIMSMY